jgi:hypothetical protein
MKKIYPNKKIIILYNFKDVFDDTELNKNKESIIEQLKLT